MDIKNEKNVVFSGERGLECAKVDRVMKKIVISNR